MQPDIFTAASSSADSIAPATSASHIAGVGDSYIQGGIRRTVLQQTALNNDVMVDLNLIEVPNGTSAAPHTHPGLELTYVLQGEFDLVRMGQPDQRYQPGMSYTVSEGDVHFARVIGERPIKLLCMFIHGKSQPVATVVSSQLG